MTAGEDLLSILRHRIARSGRITFAEFMSASLYEPGLGRYCRPDPPMGAGGDYITSPEVDEAFGLLMARALREMWESTGGRDPARPYTLIEAGPGKGTLCRDLLAGLAAEAPGLHEEIRYVLVESSELLRGEQQSLLRGEAAASGKVEWKSWRELIAAGPIRGCLLANEFLDALPVHLVEGARGRLREIYVGADDRGNLVEIPGEPSRPELEEYFRRLRLTLAEGQRAEVNLEALRWVREAAGLLERGHALIVDYGHEAAELYSESHHAGTLLGYRRHQVVNDPLALPGEQDLTAHVDFTSVREAALAAGFTDWAMTSQRNLLVAMGLAGLIASLGASGAEGSAAMKVKRRFALHALMSPSGMGGTFKALILGRHAAVAGLRLASHPFRDPVEGGGRGVYYPGVERNAPLEPSGAAEPRPHQV